MTASQSNKLAMYAAVRNFLVEFLAASTGPFPALAAKVAVLISLIDKITLLASTQEAPLTGTIGERERQLEEAVTATLEIAGPVLSYARTTGLPELIAAVSISRSHFRRLRRDSRMRLARRVHDTAASVIAQLADYGVTAEKLTALQEKIAATTAAIQKPRTTSITKKVATQQLRQLFRATDKMLAEIDPLLWPLYRTGRETYARYRTAREIIDLRGMRYAIAPEEPAAPSPAASAESAPAPAKLAA